MTNTTCIDCHRRLTSTNTKLNRQDDLCDDCYDLAGLEAEHQDGGHEDEAHPDCLLCNPNARADRSRKGKARITPHTKQSHAACYAAGTHEKNPEGRAACRKAGGPAA